MALSAGHVVRASDLAGRLGISQRTVRRDIAQLREQGYHIAAAPGVGGGYVAPSGIVLPTLQLTTQEVFTVAMALRTLAGQGGPDAGQPEQHQHGHYVESVLQKLRSLLAPEILVNLKQALQAITAAAGNEPSVPFDILVAVASAIAEKRLVDIDYSGHRQQPQRRIEPYRVVVFGAYWYLVAWDLKRSDWRVFRLDRLKTVYLTTFHFPHRVGPDPVEFVRDRVSQSVYQTIVKVRVYASADEISPRVPARAATVTPVAPGECELVMGANASEWLVAFLLHLGQDFTVVEPNSFRADVRRFRDRLSRVLG